MGVNHMGESVILRVVLLQSMLGNSVHRAALLTTLGGCVAGTVGGGHIGVSAQVASGSLDRVRTDFGRPSDMAVGPDGHLYATFRTEGVARRLDPTDWSVETVTFEKIPDDGFPYALGWVGDTLWLSDVPTSEVRLYDPGWRLIDSRPFHPPRRVGSASGAGLVGMLPGLRGVLRTGAPALAMTVGRPHFVPPPEDVPLGIPDPLWKLPIWVTNDAGILTDTLAMVSIRNRGLTVYGPPQDLPGGRVHAPGRQGEQPFTDHSLVEVGPTGSHVVIVEREVRAEDDRPAVFVYRLAPAGDTIETQRLPYVPVPMQDDWVREAARGLAEGLSEDPSEAFEVAEAGLYIPPWLPPVSEVRVGPEGWVWLGREAVPDSNAVRWDVVDLEGNFRGAVEVERDIEIRAVHRRTAWGTRASDSGGVELWLARVEADGRPEPGSDDHGNSGPAHERRL